MAHNLGLEVLLELQCESEVLAYRDIAVDMYGINNRDLANFKVDFNNSIALANLLHPDAVKIAESGIQG